MRSRRAVQKSLINKLPPGFALSKRGGIIDAIYKAFAQALAEAEAATAGALAEMSPRRADRLLPDFERVLGADPCGRDQGAKTLDERQALAWQRWIATGGQSIPYFLGMAKALGFEVTIDEYWPSIAGVMQAGTPLIPDGEQWVWVVHLRAQNLWHFRTGRNTAGEPLGGWDEGSLECIFRRLKPAHTHVVFRYDVDTSKPTGTVAAPILTLGNITETGASASGTAFAIIDGNGIADMHIATDWSVEQGGKVIWQSLSDSKNLTAIDVIGLASGTEFTISARYYGQTLGAGIWGKQTGVTKPPAPDDVTWLPYDAKNYWQAYFWASYVYVNGSMVAKGDGDATELSGADKTYVRGIKKDTAKYQVGIKNERQ